MILASADFIDALQLNAVSDYKRENCLEVN